MMWIIDTLLWARGQNFTVKSVHHIDREGFIRPGPGDIYSLTEYVYNLKTMWNYGSEWPPKFLSRERPIKKVTRASGTDITDHVLAFSGPRKNEITPIAFLNFTKTWKLRFRSPCGIQLSRETRIEPVNEPIYVETVLNQYFRVEPDKI
jgi:hypothetical protein